MSTDNGSGASNEQTGSAEGSAGSNDSTKTIKYEDHVRALDDLKKFKSQSRELEMKLQQISEELESTKQQKLAETNDYKSLYEQAANKNKEWQQKYDGLKKNVVFNEKYKAAQKALLDAGIRKEAIKILDKESLDEIVVEHTSEGRMLVNGVEDYVDSFKKNYAFAFEEKSKTRVNGGGGAAHDSKALTPLDLYTIEKKHGINSAEYKSAIEQYKKQKNR